MCLLHGSLRGEHQSGINPYVQAFLPPHMLFGMVQEERAAVIDKKVSYLQPASDYGPPEPVS